MKNRLTKINADRVYLHGISFVHLLYSGCCGVEAADHPISYLDSGPGFAFSRAAGKSPPHQTRTVMGVGLSSHFHRLGRMQQNLLDCAGYQSDECREHGKPREKGDSTK